MVVFKSGSPLGVVMEIAHSGLTSDSANELEKTDGRGFAQSSALCHMKSKSCPRGGSCSEYQRVIEKGGKFINQPGCLGWNLEGTEKLIVPPMTEDDKLAVVKPGHRNSTASVAAAGAKDLCMRYGQSNVGPWEAWKTNDGAVREAIPAELSHEKLELSSTPFCDNMILFTRKPKQAMGNSHQSGREIIMQSFKSLGFRTQSRGRVRIHLSLFVTSRLKKNPTEPSPGMVTYREFRVFGRIIKARLCFPETQNFKVRKCTPRIFENHAQLCIIPTQQSRFFDCSCSYPLLIVLWPSFLALLAGICV